MLLSLKYNGFKKKKNNKYRYNNNINCFLVHACKLYTQQSTYDFIDLQTDFIYKCMC